MKIIVHRGSHQIGGSCIEVSSGTTRIILDAGLPLDPDDHAAPLEPAVAGLFDQQGPPIGALFLSHAHADHSGLVAATRPHIRVGVTQGTSKMLLAGSLFARQPDAAAWVVFLRHNKPSGFAEDWFEQLVNREGWSLAAGAQPDRTCKVPYEQPSA